MRAKDKNNRYLVGHAAYGQGLNQLERCEFEDAAASLEGLRATLRACAMARILKFHEGLRWFDNHVSIMFLYDL